MVQSESYISKEFIDVTFDSCILGVVVEGILIKKSLKSFILPPVVPVKPTVTTPIVLAISNALTIFPEFPEVLMPTNTSPGFVMPSINLE